MKIITRGIIRYFCTECCVILYISINMALFITVFGTSGSHALFSHMGYMTLVAQSHK